MSADSVSLPAGRRNSSTSVVELLLRNRYRFFAQIRDAEAVPATSRAMLVYAALFLALFGAVIGSEHSLLQALASAVKLPLLFLVALMVCLPALYLFNTLFESSLSLGQHFALLLSGITMTSVVLLVFAPVVLFFLITTSQYQFYKLLNVAIFFLAGWIGVDYVSHGMQLVTARDRRGIRARARILWLWMLLYGFVGSQLAWTLRPFFGAPDLPFELFRGLGGNFYADVFASVGEVLGFFIVR